MENEQAEALDSNSLDDLASFLDTPEEESTEENEATPADESTADGDTETEADSEQDDAEGDEPDEVEPTPAETKITIKVKNDAGEEETLELTQDEVSKSYMRQRDYTAKTTALSKRESEAVEFLTKKHDEIRGQYVSQAEAARAAVVQLAGLRTEDELSELAASDPAAWVAEVQRQKQIGNYLQGLDKQLAAERQNAEQQHTQRQQNMLAQQYTKTWEALSAEKIDKPALAKIYGDVGKSYGFSDSELANVYDHRLVKMMRDATAYQALKAAKPAVTKQVANAPRMPTRQTQPAETRKDQALTARFKSGRAKLSDLASYLN